MSSKLRGLALPAAFLLASVMLNAAATIVIQNGDDPGFGFNDPTPVTPVGGNSGKTLGAQRLIAFQAAADKWGSTLTSTPIITIYAFWADLPCSATGAVLGSAGAYSVWSNFVGAPRPGTWFAAAEANALFGTDLDPTAPEIIAQFNVDLGQSGCLDGTYFYLGLDRNHGASIDLVTVLTHEFGHGLGFQTFTDGATGQEFYGQPSIWDYFLFDTTQNKHWAAMTDAQRATSAVNARKLVWDGSHIKADVPAVLMNGTPDLVVSAPASVSGKYQVGTAAFGPTLSTPGVSAEIMPIVDSPNNLGLACNPLSAVNAASVSHKIALVDRGSCPFAVKVKNLQNAGAVGVLIADNAAGTPPAGLGGSDPSIVIPAVRIAQADGAALRSAVTTRSRLHSGLFGVLGSDHTMRAGADTQNRALMYTPNPYEPGSSVSHWDTIATPNLLMEPAINPDLTHEVTPPHDLTYPLLQDIGWQ